MKRRRVLLALLLAQHPPCAAAAPSESWQVRNKSDALHYRRLYNKTKALMYARFSEAALCTDDVIKAWSCGDACSRTPIQNGSQVVLGPTEVYRLRGYVVHIPGEGGTGATGECVVAFTGTSFYELPNLMADAKFWLRAWPEWKVDEESSACNSSAWCPGCQVMHGFASGYSELRTQLVSAVETCSSVVLVGHSLGAGLAALAAMELRACHDVDVAEVWTFGMPRVGNADFVEAFIDVARRAEADPPIWRVVQGTDIIPRLPLFHLGFRHLPVEVFYNDSENASTFEVCPMLEDPECMFLYSPAQCSMTDHHNYLGGRLVSDENTVTAQCISVQSMRQKQVSAQIWQVAFGVLLFLCLASCLMGCGTLCTRIYRGSRTRRGGSRKIDGWPARQKSELELRAHLVTKA